MASGNAEHAGSLPSRYGRCLGLLFPLPLRTHLEYSNQSVAHHPGCAAFLATALPPAMGGSELQDWRIDPRALHPGRWTTHELADILPSRYRIVGGILAPASAMAALANEDTQDVANCSDLVPCALDNQHPDLGWWCERG